MKLENITDSDKNSEIKDSCDIENIEKNNIDKKCDENCNLINKKKGKVKSEAFPKDNFGNNIKIPEYAKIHKIITNKNIDQLVSTISYGDLKREDYVEIANLHREWFPLKYNKSFYESVLKCNDLEDLDFLDLNKKENTRSNEEIVSIGVYIKIDNKEYLIGCITSEIASDAYFKYMFNCELENSNDIYNIPFYDYNFNFSYIMTIGVIDEFRKKGISKMLIKKLIEKIQNKYTNCKGLFLHVIEHNLTAIKFYESLEFVKGRTFYNYYNINSSLYNALGFYKIFKTDEITNKDSNYFLVKQTVKILNLLWFFTLLIVYIITFGNFLLCRKCSNKKVVKVN